MADKNNANIGFEKQIWDLWKTFQFVRISSMDMTILNL